MSDNLKNTILFLARPLVNPFTTVFFQTHEPIRSENYSSIFQDELVKRGFYGFQLYSCASFIGSDAAVTFAQVDELTIAVVAAKETTFELFSVTNFIGDKKAEEYTRKLAIQEIERRQKKPNVTLPLRLEKNIAVLAQY